MTDASASKLARLKAGPLDLDRIPWPGREGEFVGIRTVRGSESRAAKHAALQSLPQVDKSITAESVLREMYEEELVYQLLFYALVDPETHDPFAASAQELRDLVDLEEAAALMEAYEAHCSAASPNLDEMTAEQLEEETDALGKASAPGTCSSTTSAKPPSGSSEFRVHSSPTASSSTSQPSSERPTPSRAPAPPASMTPKGRAADCGPGSTTRTDR